MTEGAREHSSRFKSKLSLTSPDLTARRKAVANSYPKERRGSFLRRALDIIGDTVGFNSVVLSQPEQRQLNSSTPLSSTELSSGMTQPRPIGPASDTVSNPKSIGVARLATPAGEPYPGITVHRPEAKSALNKAPKLTDWATETDAGVNSSDPGNVGSKMNDVDNEK